LFSVDTFTDQFSKLTIILLQFDNPGTERKCLYIQ